MVWDTAAVVLALLALALRWFDYPGAPRDAGIVAYGSMACGWMARRQARAREPEHAGVD